MLFAEIESMRQLLRKLQAELIEKDNEIRRLKLNELMKMSKEELLQKLEEDKDDYKLLVGPKSLCPTCHTVFRSPQCLEDNDHIDEPDQFVARIEVSE